MFQLQDGFEGERAVLLPAALIQQIQGDPFLRQLHPTEMGYYPKARYHFRHRGQGAPQHILIACVEGRGWVECGGERFEVLPNHYFILPPHTPHTYRADAQDPWTIYWFHFQGTLAHTYCVEPCRSRFFLWGERAQLSLLEEMFATLQAGYTLPNIHYVCSCLYHFLGVMKFNSERRPMTRHQNALVQRTVQYMQTHVGASLTARQIAAELGYSYAYLSALFAKNVGCSFFGYYLRLKIQQACRYLDSTDMKINEVCGRVGVEDSYYFSRLFKKTMGVSPKAYRQQVRG